MKRFLQLLIVCACLSAYSLPALSWGQKGHRVIAKIAYDNLNRKAKKAVDKTLGKGGIVYWANWPDEIKSDTIYPTSYDWHFQDFDGGLSDSIVADALIHYPAEGGNMFRALDSLVAVLKAGKGDAHTLRFVVHLSGEKIPACTPFGTHISSNRRATAIRSTPRNLNSNTAGRRNTSTRRPMLPCCSTPII